MTQGEGGLGDGKTDKETDRGRGETDFAKENKELNLALKMPGQPRDSQSLPSSLVEMG